MRASAGFPDHGPRQSTTYEVVKPVSVDPLGAARVQLDRGRETELVSPS